MPATGTRVELNLAGEWTDVTDRTYLRDRVTITRGRQDQGSRVDPGSCTLTLNNKDGRFSPRNPMGPYYGLIGRNTPVRVSVPAATKYLRLPGVSGARVSTPDAAALDILGDLDVRMDMRLDLWGAGRSYVDLMGKITADGSFSWRLETTPQGCLVLVWSPDGTNANDILAPATTPVPLPPGRRVSVRATLDVNNGAGGWTVTYYYSTTPGTSGPWTVLQTVTGTGVTSIFNSTSPVDIGDIRGTGSPAPPVGRVYSAEIRNGIAGTVVANPNFAAQAPGTSTFTDAAGRTWAFAGGVEVSDREPRFVGEVSAWPARWDVSGGDVYVPVQAAGIMRRLGQGASPLDSTLRRRIPTDATLIAYWPMEDGQGATQAYSPITGVAPMRITGLNFASDDSLGGSLAVPTVGTGASVSGHVPSSGDTWRLEFVYKIPTAPSGDANQQFLTFTTANGYKWRVGVGATLWHLNVTDADDNSKLASTIATVSHMSTTWARFFIQASQSGSNVQYTIGWLGILGPSALLTDTFAGTNRNITAITTAFPSGLSGISIGHFAVFNALGSTIFNGADTGFAEENAAERYVRLTAEEGIPALLPYGSAGAAEVGPQRPDAVLNLLEEAADADVGILYEVRDSIALAYRPRASLYNQTAALALDYAARGEVAPPLEPIEDDTATRNEVTISRPSGSSARVTLDTGPLSVLAPPYGVGRYTTSQTLNVQTDDQLPDLASWLLHLGTWDEARYPRVTVNLAAGPWLTGAACTVDIGDLITIANPPVWLPPGDIRAMVQGYTETLGVFEWEITYNCTPAGPWDIGVIGNTTPKPRANTAGCTLGADVDADDTSLTLTTTSGPRWADSATYPSDFPFDLLLGNGERVTCTAITGTTTTQTATVTRAVNGISRGWAAGDAVSLADRTYTAL